MEFSPNNPIVKLCLQGMSMEKTGKFEQARGLFFLAWNEAANDFEKYLAAYHVARMREDVQGQLDWFEEALRFAQSTNSEGAKSGLPILYLNIAKCYELLQDPDNAKKNKALSIQFKENIPDQGPFYHGTKAELKTGDLLVAGGQSNYQNDLIMNHIYFTGLISGAALAAELAKNGEHEHVYIVEPTGSFENDPNVTDKKFPGNPTCSYRSQAPLKVMGEIIDWVRMAPEELQKWKEKLADNKGEIIN